MRQINHGSDDNLLLEGHLYNIGTSDGVQWNRITFQGYKFINGKQIMVFITEENFQLTINPSFHTFTLESGNYDEFGIQIEETEVLDGKVNTRRS